MKISPELNEGDRVILVNMEGEDLAAGTRGTVIKKVVNPYLEITNYKMKWDNGSDLELLSDTDTWVLDTSNK